MIRNRDAELAQHARQIKTMIDLFWCGTMPAWAIDALVEQSTELHRAVFPPPARRRLGPAKILPFTRKAAKDPAR